MFATQLKELESRCADIAQICRRVSITFDHHSYLLVCSLVSM